ncbi:MAG TPA: LLM class flavin-dependent oxidoreductase [Pseudogracilibacillus sp.]|nr:LLM class flavin-dependent oxidoreductase [Pseudogracilibacillus sp.]
MKLSILDQSPISEQMTAKDALDATIELAIEAEKLNYERFWIAEHHDLFGLACSNPSVLISAIGAKTKQIKLGAGAVLLPYYQPFSVAETYNLLETMYPGRIDLGLGRAPGGPAEVSLALVENYLKEVRQFPEKIDELLCFLQDNFPAGHLYQKVSPTPIPQTKPRPYLLGTSEKSAILAAEKGLLYAFGDFMTEGDGPSVVRTYRENYQGKDKPYVIVAVEVICAETKEEAERLALSSIAWKINQNDIESKQYVLLEEEAERVVLANPKQAEQIRRKMIVGDKIHVYEELSRIKEMYQADEFMIVTIVNDPKKKMTSYRLLKESMDAK